MGLRLRRSVPSRPRRVLATLAMAGTAWIALALTPGAAKAAPAPVRAAACTVTLLGLCPVTGPVLPLPTGAAATPAPADCVLALTGSCVLGTGSGSVSAAATAQPTPACTVGLLGVCVGASGSPLVTITPPVPLPTSLPSNCILNSQAALACSCPDGTVSVGSTCPVPTATARPTSIPSPGGTPRPSPSPGFSGSLTPTAAVVAPVGLSFPTAPLGGAGVGAGSPDPGASIAPAVLRGPVVTTTRDLGALAGLRLGSLSLWPLVALLDALAFVALALVTRRATSGRTDP